MLDSYFFNLEKILLFCNQLFNVSTRIQKNSATPILSRLGLLELLDRRSQPRLDLIKKMQKQPAGPSEHWFRVPTQGPEFPCGTITD